MTAPAPAGLRSQARLIVMATSVSYALVMLDTSIVNVALGGIARSIAPDITSLQWVMNAYTLSFASLLLTGGALADRWGARNVYLAGLAVFIIASAACGSAAGFESLVIARALQGGGAALLVPCALKLVGQAFPKPEERARAIGFWVGWGGLAMATGPLIGGILIHILGWRCIFFVNLPAGLLGLAATWRLADDPRLRQVRPFDFAGQATSAIALAAAIYILVEGPDLGWDALPIRGSLAISLLASGAFLWAEARVQAPLLPSALFGSRIFAGSTLLSFLSAAIFYGLLFASGLHLQQNRDYSALGTGLILLPMTAMVACGSFASGRLIRWGGVRGSLCAAFGSYGLGAMGLISVGWGPPVWPASIPMLAIGLAAGFITPAATAPALETLEAQNTGVGAAILNTARQAGAASGVALSGAVLMTIHPPEAAFQFVLWGIVVIALVAASLWWHATGRGSSPDRTAKPSAGESA